jgi:hypothetical protein
MAAGWEAVEMVEVEKVLYSSLIDALKKIARA